MRHIIIKRTKDNSIALEGDFENHIAAIDSMKEKGEFSVYRICHIDNKTPILITNIIL